MHRTFPLFGELSDGELLERVSELAARERRATAELVAALMEVERRKIYLPLGCSSLFVYCTRLLHLSEHAAYNRIEAARTASLFPTVVDGLDDGSLTLAAVRLLAPVLTPENHERLLAEAKHRSKRDIELMVARERPQADAPTVVRRLPSARESARPASAVVESCETADCPPPKPPAMRQPPPVPLTSERYKIQFTASREFHAKLRRAQALLRHAVPDGDPAAILGRALDLLLIQAETRKAGLTARPRAQRPVSDRSRHIPAAVKREVWKRDGGQCAFVGALGRCAEEAFLEFHHVLPFAEGGPATTGNIQLRCRAHNAYEAEQVFKRLL